MRKLLLTTMLVSSSIFLFAQEETDLNTKFISIGLIGNGSLISINYEELFNIKPKLFISGCFGIGYNYEFNLSEKSKPANYMTIPHYITGNFGKRKRFFEFGLGGTFIIGNTEQHYLIYPIVGFRLQPWNDNFNLRGFVHNPLMKVEDIVFASYGLSLGINL